MLISDDITDNIYSFTDFSGGMDMSFDPSALPQGKYHLLINGRTRNNKLKPVRLPRKESSTPNGRHQGLFAAGSSLVVLVDGFAYYKDFSATVDSFAGVGLFPGMAPYAPTIWGELVPASTVNYKRVAVTPQNPNGQINLTNGVDGTPRALVLQDAISQPRIVEPAMTGRTAQTFGQWDPNKIMEYVPKGKMMKYHDGILYIVAVNGTELYRSLTGRPLDFVIAIDGNGNKLEAEFEEEASRLSYSVDYEALTCLNVFKAETASGIKSILYAGTAKTSFIVPKLTDSLVYGEPEFSNDPLFSLGPLNHDSYIELLGDYGIVTEAGIRLFNSSIQTGNEGTNAPLTLAIQDLFEGVEQDTTAAINFDNYGMFAVKTKFGYGVLVYDYNKRTYVALDIYPDIGAIKQFAVIKVSGRKSLWFITANGLYEAFAGSTATMQMLPFELNLNDPNGEHRVSRVQPLIQNIEEDGTISIREFADRREGLLRSKALTKNYTKPSTSSVPFGSTTDVVRSPNLVFSTSSRCKKFAPFLTLNCMAEIVGINTVMETFIEQTTEDEKAEVYK